jgi:hypothetical protein
MSGVFSLFLKASDAGEWKKVPQRGGLTFRNIGPAVLPIGSSGKLHKPSNRETFAAASPWHKVC